MINQLGFFLHKNLRTVDEAQTDWMYGVYKYQFSSFVTCLQLDLALDFDWASLKLDTLLSNQVAQLLTQHNYVKLPKTLK